MKKLRKNDQKAFTLIELLVVMGIIVVLAAIIVPKIGNARSKALMVSCQSNMKNIIKALQLYAQDYPSYGCASADNTNKLDSSTAGRATAAANIQDIFGALYYQADGDFVGGLTAFDLFICPALKSANHLAPAPNTLGFKYALSLANTSSTAKRYIDYAVMMYFDSKASTPAFTLPDFRKHPDSNAVLTECISNHNGNRNVGFVGGNVKVMSDDEMTAYKNKNADDGKDQSTAISAGARFITTATGAQSLTDSKIPQE